MEMDDGRIRTGDGNGEPGRPHKVILETVPAPRDAACEVRSVFCERPERTFARFEAGMWYETGTCTVKRKVV